MNIDVKIGARIDDVSLGAKEDRKTGAFSKVMKITLVREFDTILAQALGRDAKKVLSLLEVGHLKDATLPIDRLWVNLDLVTLGAECRITAARGTKAKAKAADDDKGTPSSIALEFEAAYDRSVWMFLGDNLAAHAEVEIKAVQVSMKGTEPQEAS